MVIGYIVFTLDGRHTFSYTSTDYLVRKVNEYIA